MEREDRDGPGTGPTQVIIQFLDFIRLLVPNPVPYSGFSYQFFIRFPVCTSGSLFSSYFQIPLPVPTRLLIRFLSGSVSDS